MTTHEIGTPSQPSRIDRRRMLRSAGALSGAAALLGAPALAQAADPPVGTLTLDVACDGRTLRLNRTNQAGAIGLPLFGDAFIVYGSVYPAGTVEAGLTGPDQAGAVGRWICWGTFLVDLASEQTPHVTTTVLFALGDGVSSSAGQVDAAPDGLLTIGLEGGPPRVVRTLSGGYGQYAGALGTVVQATVGENDTLLRLAPEVAVPAPLFTFTFEFGE